MLNMFIGPVFYLGVSFLDWWSDVIIVPAKNGSKWLQLHGIVCTNRKEAQLSVGVVFCILVLSGSEGKIPRGLSKMFLIFPVIGHVSQQWRNLIQIPKYMIKWLKIYLTLELLIHRFFKKRRKPTSTGTQELVVRGDVMCAFPPHKSASESVLSTFRSPAGQQVCWHLKMKMKVLVLVKASDL